VKLFLPYQRELSPKIMTFELLGKVRVNQHAKYVGQHTHATD